MTLAAGVTGTASATGAGGTAGAFTFSATATGCGAGLRSLLPRLALEKQPWQVHGSNRVTMPLLGSPWKQAIMILSAF